MMPGLYRRLTREDRFDRKYRRNTWRFVRKMKRACRRAMRRAMRRETDGI
jgi:hypothetical protein